MFDLLYNAFVGFFEYSYYFFVLYFLFIEINYLINTQAQIDNNLRIIEIGKENTENKLTYWKYFSPEYKGLIKRLFLKILAISIVMIGGLFTMNWPILVLFLLTNLIIVSPLTKYLDKNKKPKNLLVWINSLYGFILALFIIINKFHLHLDIYKIVENFL